MPWWGWLLLWLPLATAVGITIGKGIRVADREEGRDA